MNKLIIVGFIVLIVGAGGFLVLKQSDPATYEVAIDSDSKMSAENITQGEKLESRYVEYSNIVLENTSSTRRILFFYASWCPTCRPTDANLKANEDKIPEDVTVIRVNYNDPETDQGEKDLAKKYGITYQHTFVQIDSSGQEIVKWNGGQLTELLANIK